MRVALLFLVASLAVSANAAGVTGAPPAEKCKKATQGRYWPEDANDNRELAKKLMQTGELQICVMGFWKYKWQPLTVNYHSLIAPGSEAEKRRAGSSSEADSASYPESAKR